LGFDMGIGSTYRGTAGSWQSGSKLGVTGAVSHATVLSAEFAVTGVKLEIGSIATPFNRRGLAVDLAECQRYYQRLGFRFTGAAEGVNQIGVVEMLSTPMRVAPTLTLVPGVNCTIRHMGTDFTATAPVLVAPAASVTAAFYILQGFTGLTSMYPVYARQYGGTDFMNAEADL
jgi:hypothetical protein